MDANHVWMIKDAHAFLPGRGFCPRTGILVRGGKIAAVAADMKGPRGARIFDAQGAWVTPGLVDGHTHMGMTDHPSRESDVTENCEPLTPYADVRDAINPFNEVFPHALLNGVTTVMVLPGSGNVVGGMGAVVKTHGTLVDRMVVRAPAGMKMALGYNPKQAHGAKGRAPCTRMGNAYLLRKTLQAAREYRARRRRARNRPAADLGMENLLLVLDGRVPARIHCHRADDIMTALRLSAEYAFPCCLDHATEGHRVAGELVRRKIGCFLGPNLLPPTKQETVSKGFANVVKLHRAGVRLALVSDHGIDPSCYLSIIAGLAVRAGLPEEDGLLAVTQWPAELLGVAHRIGRLAKGRDADIVAWDRHPLFMGKPVLVLAGGVAVTAEALKATHHFREL